MKKNFLLWVIIGVFPLSMNAQDDLYFTPTKTYKSTVKEKLSDEPVYYCGSDRDVDEYNHHFLMGSYYQYIDSLGNDTIHFEPGVGEYPNGSYRDSIEQRMRYDDDFVYSRRLGRFDDFYGWYDPWFYGYRSPWHYRLWHDPWYYGWHDPWFYGWYDPWYYGWYPSYYWGWGNPYRYWGWNGWYGPGYWGGGIAGVHRGHHPSGVRSYSFPRNSRTQVGGERSSSRFGSRSNRSYDSGSSFGNRTYNNSSSHSFGNSSTRSFGGSSSSGGRFSGGGSFGGGSRGGGGGHFGHR